ncbi:hypothetical protein [Sphingomonas bacterium]|uniref:hypothetical protein n=1 Tax=Sphingomonas bacterium TaxID=1895847 RepID=UPI0026304C49|nr:hypothetical protein [Sphingomonas bacterium]MDB5677591.1 hypothetical protein [Sphingomonas bacterium]
MIRRPILLAAVCGIAGAAQGQTGSIRSNTAPIEVPEGRSTGDVARAVSDNFALCIVKRHYPQVVKMLAPPLDTAHDFKFLPKLMDGECFTGSSAVGREYGMDSVEMNTNPVAFRGALYKALVRKDFGRRPATFGAAALVMSGDNSGVLQFAGCVVRADPGNSLKLLQAVAGAPAEQAAIGALKPRFDQCTPPGVQHAFSKGSLIGYLAEAYYREADASKPTSSN